MCKARVLAAVILVTVSLVAAPSQAAVAVRAGFNTSALAANDDGSTGLTGFGFAINFFGVSYSDAYLNNNGNMTFTGPLSTYTPFGITGGSTPMIAPFFADVDTRNAGSGLMRYGTGVVGARPAFGVTWGNDTNADTLSDLGVGYFPSAADKLNLFQMIIVDRSDIGPGDFDLEFNYNQMQWETGGASGGSGGLGGASAHIGYTNGLGTFYEFPGSGVNGTFLDGSGTSDELITHMLNSTEPGRYIFFARNGDVTGGAVPEPSALIVWSLLGVLGLGAGRYYQKRRS